MENTRLSAMLSAKEDPRAVVAFKAGEVQGKAVILAAGDEVEFAVVPGAKPGELVAKCVSRTKEAPNPEGERQYSSLRGKLLAKGQTAPMAPQSKFAKGPDGTRGFGPPGCDRRGNPLPVVEPPPLEATDGVSGDT